MSFGLVTYRNFDFRPGYGYGRNLNLSFGRVTATAECAYGFGRPLIRRPNSKRSGNVVHSNLPKKQRTRRSGETYSLCGKKCVTAFSHVHAQLNQNPEYTAILATQY